VPKTKPIEIDAVLLERVSQAAAERNVAVRRVVERALERELGRDETQPPFPLVGAFTAGRSDLSARTSDDAFERRRTAAERARGMLGRDASRSFSDELLAERRADARVEDREDEARRRRG
jgi:hypothetical protein